LDLLLGCLKKKGVITFEDNDKSEDVIRETVTEAGAEDIQLGSGSTGHTVEVICKGAELVKVRKELEKRGFVCSSAELTYVTVTPADLDEESAQQLQILVDTLEEHEDVQQVYHNHVETR